MPPFFLSRGREDAKGLAQHSAIAPDPATCVDASPDRLAGVDLVHATEHHFTGFVARLSMEYHRSNNLCQEY
jgi:hypothetical protein